MQSIMTDRNLEWKARNPASCLLRGVFIWLIALTLWVPPALAFNVELDLVPATSQLVGDSVSLTAQPRGPGGLDLRYQFSVRADGGDWRVVRDFDTTDSFQWATLDEGAYELRVVAIDLARGKEKTATATYLIESRITDGNAELTLTSNSLVALYSAPPCTGSGFLHVRFKPVAGGDWTQTPFKPCGPDESVNFYLAGMTPDTNHVAFHAGTDDGSLVVGDPIIFTTGSFTLSFADNIVVPIPPNAQTSEEDVVLLSYVGAGTYSVATNLEGEPIWYFDVLVDSNVGGTLLRPVAGGTMLYTLRDQGSANQRFVEIDLAGNIVRETNFEWVNVQLAALGEERNNSFHHDAIRLPNDYTAIMGRVEKILTDVQGPGDIDVLGDSIIVLDENFQVVWVWDSFVHLDPTEVAILGETCVPGQGGCPAELAGDELANDWTHSNGLDYTAEDGNLIISVRHLDAVFKVDYADGAGTGAVVWRLGRGGDFTMVDPSGDPFPWFSHQHYTHFEDGLFVVYDNGNTRVSETGSGGSRVQIIVLDETNKIAVLASNQGLGAYATALGSAEILSNGNISADTSALDSNDYPFLLPDARATFVTEVLPNGQLNYVWATTGVVYRAWRMKSLYKPAS